MNLGHVFSSVRATIQPITQGTDRNVQVEVQKHRSVPEDVFEGHPVAQAQLYNSPGALASETGGSVMEILHIIMQESIKENNETKRMMLQRLDDLNRISKALGQSLESLADSSGKLASRENKDESDAKVQVGYDLYHHSMVGLDGQPIKIPFEF